LEASVRLLVHALTNGVTDARFISRTATVTMPFLSGL
jgi:hypothetical protein